MSNWFRRFWAFILTAVLLLTVFPAAVGAQGAEGGDKDEPRVFTQADDQLLEDDVFARIDAVTAPSSGGPKKAPKRAPQTEAEFAALVPQVIEAVEASDTYVEGTLQNNGGVLTWETTVGMPCTYNPRMEAKLRGTAEKPTKEERAALENLAAELKEKSASVKKAPALRGPGAGSMKIGLIQPFWESDSEYADRAFRSFSPYYVRTWQELCAAAGGEGLRYTMSNATVDNIAYAIEECGIVIFDSHGNIDTFSTSSANTSYLCLTTTEGITTADADVQTDPNGYMYFNCLKGDGYAEVNGACIANHMTKNAPNSLLYMGICYGMATDRLCAPLREKGVECCWGYSQPVSFAGDVLYMMTIMNRVGLGEYFCLAAEYAKQTYGYWDCASSYATAEEARQHDAAFPICVSSDDPYPGQGNVNAVQRVRSTWTLFPRDLPVIAVPDDFNHGTVQVAPDSSYTYLITASPEAGWYPAECVVESGNAAVTRESDFTFLVDMNGSASETCSVTVKFRELKKCDVPVAVAPPVKGDAAAPAVTVAGKGALKVAPEGWYESFGGTMNSFGPLAESITVGQTYYAAATVSPAYGYYVGSLEAIAATGADVAFIGTSGSDIRCVFAAKGTFIPVSLTVYRTSVDGTDTDPSLALTGLEKGPLLSDVLVQNGVSPDVQFAQAGYKTMDCLTPKPFGAYGSQEELSADSVSPFFRLEEDTVLYCPMIKLIDAVELTVTPPVCGAATGTLHPEEPWTDQTDPPAVAVPEGVHYAPNAKDGGNAAWWSDPDTNKGYTGTFTGGQSYPLGFSLAADFGYEFSVDADAVTVRGGELLGNTVDNTGHLLEATVSVTAVHSFGNWAVTTGPTCVDEGEETRVCAGCPATETRPVAATGIHTYGETGDERFTCMVCQQIDAGRRAAAEAADREAADRAAAEAVAAKIDTIGEVAYTDESKAKIDAAKSAYDALTDAQKALVTNAQTLTDAIVRYAELKTQAETPTDPTDPTNPTDPDTPSDGHTCPWDGVDHGTSIWGRLVRFFHAILYFFARLFGRR